jgi:hypothetical protein
MSARPYSTAVRQYRKPALPNNVARQPWEDLDLYCTPPWATRALMHIVLPQLDMSLQGRHVIEPACGLGHMSDVLAEQAGFVYPADVFDYGQRWRRDFLKDELGASPDWTVTNPPFKHAEAFAQRALSISYLGVAFLVRSAWLEGVGRYQRLFRLHPPTVVAQFVERVPMVKGRWNPQAKTATSYSWVVWTTLHEGDQTRFMHIPPCRKDMSRPYDFDVFAHRQPPAIVGAP